MKSYYFILLSFILFTFTYTVPASAFEYSLSVRTTYMQGCFLDDPPDFANNSKVFLKMKRCLCMMDKFLWTYLAMPKKFIHGKKGNLMILLKSQCKVA